MPRNGSGTYVAPASPGAFNPATVGGSATDTAWNALLADLSTAMSGSIAADGQTTVTADIPMATHKITGLGNATAQTDALNQQSALYLIDQQDATAVSFIDFTNIAATVNNLKCIFEVQPGTTATSFTMQTYGADGVLDTGVSDYVDAGLLMSQVATGSFGITGGSIRFFGGDTVSTSVVAGFSCQFTAANIQAATFTKFINSGAYWNGSAYNTFSSMGSRLEADRITGFRVTVSSGVFTGKFTLFGSV